MAVRRQHIQRLVDSLLVQQGVTAAPVPVEQLAAAHRVQIVLVPAEEELSGFLVRHSAPESSVIGVNKSEHHNRRRFTIAHELGHLFLHATEPVHVDKTATVFHRGPSSSMGLDDHEIEANLFAAELLMPTRLLRNDVTKAGYLDFSDEGPIRALAKSYQVSAQAMSIRLANLGFLVF